MNDSDLRAQLSLALGGGYIIDRELETTRRSRLFVARELTHDRDVVVKVLPEEITAGVNPERFAREIHLVGALQEPHTVPIYTTGQTATGRIYYTMPYIAEPSLGYRLEQAPISFDDTVSALRDVAKAMENAHRQGIVHGDIKPENVFLIRGTAVVTDFGVASALDASRSEEAERGRLRLVTSSVATPAYIAPEHLSAGPAADHRADIYAWGVMAYELLYDIHPFPDVNTIGELLEAHMSAPPMVPPHKAFGVPEQLASLVMRCLAKDPAERPSNASELLEVLDRIPSGAAALSVESWSPYRLIGMALLAFVAFVGLAASIWRLQSWGNTDQPLIAVLPFESSGIAADTLFAEALATGISAKLEKLGDIRVVDVASTHMTPAGAATAAEAGKALGATYLLRATVRWFRDVDGTARAQVSPTLIQTSDGAIKWVGAPELAFAADPFTPQSSLATQAARELGIELGPAQKTILAERGTSDTAAYAAFTRGNELYWRGTELQPVVPAEALAFFERAFALDPRYADALASAADLLSRAALSRSTPELLDSVSRAARRALAVSPNNTRALVASARVALLKNRQEEALAAANRAIDANPSDVAALQLRSELSLLAGDSSAVWHDVERIVRIAPRSPNALRDVATTSAALRRFGDAREYLRRARALMPHRADLVLHAAELARQTGNVPEMIRLVHDARAMGGVVGVDELALLRAGDTEMQNELLASSPVTFSAATPADTFHYYMEKGKLLLQRHLKTSTVVLDSAAGALLHVLDSRATSPLDRRMYVELSSWLEAARGNAQRAIAGVTDVTQSVQAQRYPSGAFAAFVACNDAETYALIGWVERMLPPLERCLRLPGGYGPSAILGEPALALQARDPRLGALLGQMGLNLDHQ